jgi:hypothetical protein
VYHKAVLDKKSAGVVARLAKQAAVMYHEVSGLFNSQVGGSGVGWAGGIAGGNQWVPYWVRCESKRRHRQPNESKTNRRRLIIVTTFIIMSGPGPPL